MTAVTDLAAAIPSPSAPEGWTAGTWTIDPAHTTVSFVVRHLMSRIRGAFGEVSGQIITRPDLSGSTAAATIAVSSVRTGNEMRDNHLRSADFFEAERYPVMSFASTGLRQADGSWLMSGELTIRDVTQPVDLEVEFLGTDPTGLQGEARIGFSARGTISRRDFGITFGLAAGGAKIVLADQVDIVLDVQAFLGA
jgi:polyisoprenoid-binding protein YceI